MLIAWLVLSGRWRVHTYEGIGVGAFFGSLVLALAEAICELLLLHAWLA